MKYLKNNELQFEFFENGLVKEIKSNDVFIFENSENSEFYLRIIDEKINYYPMLKSAKVTIFEDKIVYKGIIEKIKYEIIFMLEDNLWMYRINLFKGDDFVKVDIVYTQSINIHIEKIGKKLFVDNVIHQSNGFKITTFQNQKMGKDNSYVQLGCTYHTKGFNIYDEFSTDFLKKEILKCEMKNNNATNFALQTSEIFLENNKVELTFYGYYLENRENSHLVDVEKIIMEIVNHDFSYYED